MPVSPLTELLERNFAWQLDEEPGRRTVCGLEGPHDRWEQIGEAADDRRIARWRADLVAVDAMAGGGWGAEDRLNAEIFRHHARLWLEGHRFRAYDPPVGLFGCNVLVPFILTTYQSLAGVEDFGQYLARVRDVPRLFDEAAAVLTASAARGLGLPGSSYGPLIQGCRNVIRGRPFDGGPTTSGLLADVSRKIDRWPLSDRRRAGLKHEAACALRDYLGPAYRRLIACLEAVRASARDAHGAWALPAGDEYYAHALFRHAETTQDPEAIHATGLAEVAELHDEIRFVAGRLGESGTLGAFFEALRAGDKYHYPESEAARGRILEDARAIVARIEAELPRCFSILPRARVVVERMPAHMEQSSPVAVYRPGTRDGATPGAYLMNLGRPSLMPRYLMTALAVHEAIPGHHLQLALVNEASHLPDFRRHQPLLTAFTEGWALYAEQLADELAIYDTALARLGYLVMRLWRSARLVVDTGIHALRWSREDAIRYFMDNAPLRRGQVESEVERYIQWPGQAVAYRLGCRRLVRLREAARRSGPDFDLAGFHAAVLAQGQLPLSCLERQVGLPSDT